MRQWCCAFLERMRFLRHSQISGVVGRSGPHEGDALHVDAFRVSECISLVGALQRLQVVCICRECAHGRVVFISHLTHDAQDHVVIVTGHRD